LRKKYLIRAWAIWALVMPFIFLFGIGFYGLTVALKWKELNQMSVAEFFKRRYSPFLAKMVSLCLLCSMAGFCATYIKSMSVVFHSILPQISMEGIGFIVCIFVLLMTIRGGLFSVIRLDVVSFILTVFFFLFGAFFSWKSIHFVGIGTINHAMPIRQAQIALPLSFVISLIFLCMFTYILAPWYGQKIVSAKSKKIAKMATITSSILVFLIYSLAIIMCAFVKMKGIALDSMEQALPIAFVQLLPKGFGGIGFALFFTAGATTLAGVWSAMVAMLIADFLKKDHLRSKALPVISTIGFAVCCFILSITLVDRIFEKLILFNIPIFALSFALLGGFYLKTTTTAAVVSIVCGLIWGVFCYMYWGEPTYILYWVFGGLPLLFLSGYSLSFFHRKSYRLQ